jgi:hypothetical protein
MGGQPESPGVSYALTIHDQNLGDFLYLLECAQDKRSLAKRKKAGDIRKFHFLFHRLYFHRAKRRIIQDHHRPPGITLRVGGRDVHSPHPPDLTYLIFMTYQMGQALLKS